MPPANGWRTRFAISSPKRDQGARDRPSFAPRWQRRSSSRPCAGTWNNCRPTRPGGWPLRGTTSSAEHSALHREPGHRWSLDDLAAEAGTSRSVLVERFSRFLGEPPLTYLARWRLQLAARRIQTTRSTILQVALDVGYESEAAFNRAFKRDFGLPPAQYRKKIREQAEES